MPDFTLKDLKRERRPVYSCPFCAGDSMIVHDYDQHKQIWCTSCGALGPVADTEDEAAQRWNERRVQMIE